ncbi:MAG: copper homeostasis protein CutC [Tabrizicola sp.]|uniref:copper homeostasis protein CutC n=1 Tax=Tabrizicola sp. TaxID=2005166 RepID=UPI002ABA4E45|nr:copper homeostasis protein CutC [Tabrizicola sp.]MDZ4087912.1 copper homeostasis protein CutC [Tabrizicola sp.]
MGVTLEVCVDTAEGLAQAVAGGADRIELCAALALGGLTPSAGLMALAAGCGVPVVAMIRPRAGDFVWSEAEVGMMEAEIASVRAAGLAGVVLGASLPDGRLDLPVLRRLVAAARGAEGGRFLQRNRVGAFEGSGPEFSKTPGDIELVLHRCIDLVPDMGAALEEVVALGFHRILTSGGETRAEAGAARIGALLAQAAGRISVMPGSGVNPGNAALLKGLGISDIHASCSTSTPASGLVVEMGFAPPVQRQTHADLVRALRAALK